MKGVQLRNVGLEVAGMLCTALLLGHYPLHTGREIFICIQAGKFFYHSEIEKQWQNLR